MCVIDYLSSFVAFGLSLLHARPLVFVSFVNGWHKTRLVAAVKVAIISQARDRLAVHIVRCAVFIYGSVVQVSLGFRANAELNVGVGCTCRSGKRGEG